LPARRCEAGRPDQAVDLEALTAGDQRSLAMAPELEVFAAVVVDFVGAIDEHAVGHEQVEVHVEIDQAPDRCTNVVTPVRGARRPRWRAIRRCQAPGWIVASRTAASLGPGVTQRFDEDSVKSPENSAR
jgi:hypothetical protein